MIRTLSEYQKEANKTMNWSIVDINEYLYMKLVEEVNELRERILKDSNFLSIQSSNTKSLVEELGDIMWYIATIASHNNISLQTVAEFNIFKLRERHGENFNEDYYQNKELP